MNSYVQLSPTPQGLIDYTHVICDVCILEGVCDWNAVELNIRKAGVA